jgi:outer membrane protein assembly factor BamB
VLAALVLAASLAGAARLAAAPQATPAVDWTRFGYDAQRSSSGPASTGITAANVRRLKRQQVQLDGTVDSSAIFLHGVKVHGAAHDVLVMTTTYGHTEALDARNGRLLWRYVPPGTAPLLRSPQITTATPVADTSRRFVFAASPDGQIQKLSLADGHAVWRTPVTLLPQREKIASSLNLWKGRVIVTTGGYIGDAPPYQGHVVLIGASSGKIVGVWNSLCSDRHHLIQPSTCGASDSAIWGRAGAVVEPSTGALLVATGNAPFDGKTNWGDSLIRLSPDVSHILGSWTPTNAQELDTSDLDLGSTSPVLAGGSILQGGKDGKLRVLAPARLAPAGRRGGELQTVQTPGSTDLFTAPAVWRSHGTTWVFVADNDGLRAWTLSGGRLHLRWHTSTSGTSPVVAGGLLYVYAPQGGLNVYVPTSGHRITTLPAGSGHWNSPIVVDRMVVLPEGSANDHSTHGVLDIYRLP